MVAALKDDARKAFAELLNAELDRVGVPKERARIGWLYKNVKKKPEVGTRLVPLVSREQFRKWIRGKDIPDQANLMLLCDQLKLDWARLQTGRAAESLDPDIIELHAELATLDRTERKAVRTYVRLLKQDNQEANDSPVARPEGDDDSEGERALLQRHRRA